MTEPKIRDLPKVMIVDHCLNNIREMQKIDFAKLGFKPYFVYYGDQRENLPEGVRRYSKLDAVVNQIDTEKIQGIITGRQRTLNDEADNYGIDLAKKIRQLEPRNVREDVKNRLPIVLHGSDELSSEEDKKLFDATWVRGADMEYEEIGNMVSVRQTPRTRILNRAHIVTHGLVYEPGAAKIFDRKPHVLITSMQAESEDELFGYAKMLGKGVDVIMLGVSDSGDIQSTLRVAEKLKQKIEKDFLSCSVSIIWTGNRFGFGNAIPEALEEGAAALGVRVAGKHQMGVEAARVEQAKTGMPKSPIFI
jgi:hypothetical protein